MTKHVSRVIGAVIAQFIFLTGSRVSRDITFDNWPYYLSTQFVQHLSIITACIPYIKNVLLGLESGMFQTGHFHLQTLRAVQNKPQHHGSISAGCGRRHHTTASAKTSDHTNHQASCDIVMDRSLDSTSFYAENTAIAEAVTPVDDWDDHSQSSQANIINKRKSGGWVRHVNDR